MVKLANELATSFTQMFAYIQLNTIDIPAFWSSNFPSWDFNLSKGDHPFYQGVSWGLTRQQQPLDHYWLVVLTILKNDGVRQWEGLSHIWNGKIIQMFQTTNQSFIFHYQREITIKSSLIWLVRAHSNQLPERAVDSVACLRGSETKSPWNQHFLWRIPMDFEATPQFQTNFNTYPLVI